MKGLTIEIAKQFLKEQGYFTDMWNVSDIKEKFECTDEQAMKVLEDTFNGEYLRGEINDSISIVAEAHGLKELSFLCGNCGERCSSYKYDEDKDIDVGNCCQ